MLVDREFGPVGAVEGAIGGQRTDRVVGVGQPVQPSRRRVEHGDPAIGVAGHDAFVKGIEEDLGEALLPSQPLGRLADGGDVVERGHGAGDATVVEEGLGVGPDPEGWPARALHSVDGVHRPAAGLHGPDHRVARQSPRHRVAVGQFDPQPPGLSEQLGEATTDHTHPRGFEHDLERLVDLQDGPRAVDDHDPFGERFDDRRLPAVDLPHLGQGGRRRAGSCRRAGRCRRAGAAGIADRGPGRNGSVAARSRSRSRGHVSDAEDHPAVGLETPGSHHLEVDGGSIGPFRMNVEEDRQPAPGDEVGEEDAGPFGALVVEQAQRLGAGGLGRVDTEHTLGRRAEEPDAAPLVEHGEHVEGVVGAGAQPRPPEAVAVGRKVGHRHRRSERGAARGHDGGAEGIDGRLPTHPVVLEPGHVAARSRSAVQKGWKTCHCSGARRTSPSNR